jgi:hypothetical protein
MWVMKVRSKGLVVFDHGKASDLCLFFFFQEESKFTDCEPMPTALHHHDNITLCRSGPLQHSSSVIYALKSV